MYFVLEEDRQYAFMAAFSDTNPGHDAKWTMGKLMDPDDKPGRLTLIIDEPLESYPDFFTEIPVDFCSQRMRERLKAAGVDNVEFYALEMRERSGKRIDGYFAVNIIGRIAGLDRERSKFTEWRKRVARIQSLALNESAIKGLKIFRLHEYSDVIFVSEEVAEAVRGLPGVSLKPAEGWSDAHRFSGEQP